MKIGMGYDVHKLVEGRDLIIGGVKIPYEKGLLGHSDADVLVHGIMDGILGALGKGDIGKHFPDTDMEYKDISSLELLKRVKSLMDDEGYEIGNIDTVIAAQKPKMASYIEEMKSNIGDVLKTKLINIKATTTEELGAIGEGKGISSYSVVLLKKRNNFKK